MSKTDRSDAIRQLAFRVVDGGLSVNDFINHELFGLDAIRAVMACETSADHVAFRDIVEEILNRGVFRLKTADMVAVAASAAVNRFVSAEEKWFIRKGPIHGRVVAGMEGNPNEKAHFVVEALELLADETGELAEKCGARIFRWLEPQSDEGKSAWGVAKRASHKTNAERLGVTKAIVAIDEKMAAEDSGAEDEGATVTVHPRSREAFGKM